MGAHPDDYARAAPFKSYIHVDDFTSPRALADYLHLLDQNPDLYNQYFKWGVTFILLPMVPIIAPPSIHFVIQLVEYTFKPLL